MNPIKSRFAGLLNRLNDLQSVGYYATVKDTFIQCESTIRQLEIEIDVLVKRLEQVTKELQTKTKVIAQKSDSTDVDERIDELAFSYVPNAPIGQLREFAQAVLAAKQAQPGMVPDDVIVMIDCLRHMGLEPCKRAADMIEALATHPQPDAKYTASEEKDWVIPGVPNECAGAVRVAANLCERNDYLSCASTLRAIAAAMQPHIKPAAPSEGAQAEKCVACEGNPSGSNNPCAVCGCTTPTAAADGETAEQARAALKAMPISEVSKLLQGRTAAAPLASSADTIDGPEFEQVLHAYRNSRTDFAERKAELIAHIDAHIAEARQQGSQEGRIYQRKVDQKIIDHLRVTSAAATPKAVELPKQFWESIIRKADNFCPTDLSTPEKWRWKADYISAAVAIAMTQEGSKNG